jgi:hypothetical protein
VAEDRPCKAYRPYLAGVTAGRGRGRALKKHEGVTDCIDRRCNARPAPDAFDELRHTVHSVAVVRHDAAHAPLHVHQAAVGACEEQHTALARAVVSERNLRNSHASDTK